MSAAITFSRSSIRNKLLFTFLVFGYGNAVLRLNENSGITLFRVFLPLVVFYCLTIQIKKFYRFLLIGSILCLYSLPTSLLSRYHYFDLSYVLHYISLLFLLFLVTWMIKKIDMSIIYRHLKSVYIGMLVLCYLELITGIKLPNTLDKGTLNGFFYNENDLSAALGIFIPFLLVEQKKRMTNLLLSCAGIFIIHYNESRIALISIVLFAAYVFIYKHKLIFYTGLLLATMQITYLLNTIKVGTNTLFELIVDPVKHFANLEPYNLGGSVYDRTDALIYATQEIINSYGFGIGPGNTTRMLATPQFATQGAESLHNFFYQVLAEYGWLFIIGIIIFICKIYRIRGVNPLLTVYFLCAVLTSISQSEGLFSNYYFFVVLYFSIFFFDTDAHRKYPFAK